MKSKKTTLIIGATGQIGNYLYRLGKRAKFNIWGTSFSDRRKDIVFMDIRDEASIDLIKKIRPDVIFFTAFIPDVDYCEKYQSITRKTNVEPMVRIVDLCKNRKIKLVYYSTDYIFDGEGGPYSEDDVPNPLSEYGKQKLYVEELISNSLSDFMVLRVTWVYGWEFKKKNFVLRLVNSLHKGQNVRVPVDQFSNPTYAGNIAKTTWKLIEKDYSGTLNIADKDFISKYNFARKVARFKGLSESLIEGVQTKDLEQSARRPLKGGLKVSLTQKILNEEMMGVDESLKIMYSLDENKKILGFLGAKQDE